MTRKPRLLFFQTGSYTEVSRRLRSGGIETYRDQKAPVDFVASMRDRIVPLPRKSKTAPDGVRSMPFVAAPDMHLFSRVERKLWSLFRTDGAWIDRRGDFRLKERYGRINRPNYAYGMLRAASIAKYFGKKSVTVIEFGVASGDGLLNMIELASTIQQETGIVFRVVGFDNGAGLPAINGYKDHPEIWNPSDFAMENRERLEKQIAGKAQIIWGDIADTVSSFLGTIEQRAPIGFVSVDVDIYSATVSALRCFDGPSDRYLPAVSMYFDDVSFFFANRWAGELAAIAEFNDAHELRKIDIDRSLSMRPLHQSWHSHMYVLHVLDHEGRQQSKDRAELGNEAHFRFMASQDII